MSLFNTKISVLPEIPEKERTPLVNEILETCSFQKEQLALKNEIIQALKDEIARLKGEKPKPISSPQILKKVPAAVITAKNQKTGRDQKKERRTVTSRFTIPFLFLRIIFLKGADLKAMTITLFKIL